MLRFSDVFLYYYRTFTVHDKFTVEDFYDDLQTIPQVRSTLSFLFVQVELESSYSQ